jgi:hypothetical protein
MVETTNAFIRMVSDGETGFGFIAFASCSRCQMKAVICTW